MTNESPGTAFRLLHVLFNGGTVAGLTDEQLLQRFTTPKDATAEAAFEALVERHGPMVLRVCRNVLDDHHDAEDAFQATFLVLALKAGSVRKHSSLASWLLRVARRVALKARADASRRRAREVRVNMEDLPSDPARSDSARHADRPELRTVIDEEVAHLPEKYRAPIVLCYLEGLTQEVAAQQLGWPAGTVRGRIARARELLRTRLARRGLALPVGLMAAAIPSKVEAAALPSALVGSTVRAAMQVAAGEAITVGTVSASVAALARGALRMMTVDSRSRSSGFRWRCSVLQRARACSRRGRVAVRARSRARRVSGERHPQLLMSGVPPTRRTSGSVWRPPAPSRIFSASSMMYARRYYVRR
jgi:RNA polymerase sigma factor (sigma-70 family)